ncbi:MAG: hypothetical protein ACRD0P_39370, partial [Stackebrandtia sp.]
RLQGPDGFPAGPGNEYSKWDRARLSAKGEGTIPKFGQYDKIAKLEKVGKVTGPLGKALMVGTAGYKQAQQDAYRTDLGGDQKAFRAGYRATVEGGMGVGGAVGGAALGTAIGTLIVPGPGTAIGAAVGGVIGGIAGGWGGGEAGGAIVDHTIEGVTSGDAALGRRGRGGYNPY